MGGSLLCVWVLPPQLKARVVLDTPQGSLSPSWVGISMAEGLGIWKTLGFCRFDVFDAIREISLVRALAASFCAMQRESEISKSFKIHFKGVFKS